ncbi:hypothetical protein C0992_011059, partial [Termitomyces sp. T32_za158]
MTRVASSSKAGPAAHINNQVRVKTERDKGKGKARVEEETEDVDENVETYEDEEDADGQTDEERGSLRLTKRTRVNKNGDSRPGDYGKPTERVKTLPRDTDG